MIVRHSSENRGNLGNLGDLGNLAGDG